MIGKIQVHEAPPTRRFPAIIVSVHDGDTVEAQIDIGFGLTLIDHVRIYGINCPELNNPEGVLAKNRTVELMTVGGSFILVAQKKREKYGRVLGDFELGDGSTLADVLLVEGHAVKMLFSAPPDLSDVWLD
jgi:endonuclease YncB( thermonuclease family)